MAWFALSLRTPKALWWPCSAQDTSPHMDFPQQSHTQDSGKIHESHVPHASANIFTLRIFEPSLRPNLLATLRAAIAERGGTVVGDLLDKRGFIFSMPPDTQSPLTGYQHGNLLEEGCIQITKENGERRRRSESVESSDDDEQEEDEEEHEAVHLKWRWKAVKR